MLQLRTTARSTWMFAGNGMDGWRAMRELVDADAAGHLLTAASESSCPCLIPSEIGFFTDRSALWGAMARPKRWCCAVCIQVADNKRETSSTMAMKCRVPVARRL